MTTTFFWSSALAYRLSGRQWPLGLCNLAKTSCWTSPVASALSSLASCERFKPKPEEFVQFSIRNTTGNVQTAKAVELVRSGAIGRVISTVGLGPHRLGHNPRPDWFWDTGRSGSILTDIASHQFEQFLSLTGATEARILHSVENNFDHPDSPKFLDYGHAVVAGGGATGYVRVDWFTPDGSPVWGDGRLFIVGTEGSMELRKYMDIEGRKRGNHLFLTDKAGTHYIDCSDTELTYGVRLRNDVRNRTETAMTQTHCFLATELALEAHKKAESIAGVRPDPKQ